MDTRTETVFSNIYKYNLPVFEISPKNINGKTYNEVVLNNIEIAPNFNNITYNNNCIRWLRNDYDNRDIMRLCSLYITPGYYPTMADVIKQFNIEMKTLYDILFEVDSKGVIKMFSTYTGNISKSFRMYDASFEILTVEKPNVTSIDFELFKNLHYLFDYYGLDYERLGSVKYNLYNKNPSHITEVAKNLLLSNDLGGYISQPTDLWKFTEMSNYSIMNTVDLTTFTDDYMNYVDSVISPYNSLMEYLETNGKDIFEYIYPLAAGIDDIDNNKYDPLYYLTQIPKFTQLNYYQEDLTKTINMLNNYSSWKFEDVTEIIYKPNENYNEDEIMKNSEDINTTFGIAIMNFILGIFLYTTMDQYPLDNVEDVYVPEYAKEELANPNFKISNLLRPHYKYYPDGDKSKNTAIQYDEFSELDEVKLIVNFLHSMGFDEIKPKILYNMLFEPNGIDGREILKYFGSISRSWFNRLINSFTIGEINKLSKMNLNILDGNISNDEIKNIKNIIRKDIYQLLLFIYTNTYTFYGLYVNVNRVFTSSRLRPFTNKYSESMAKPEEFDKLIKGVDFGDTSGIITTKVNEFLKFWLGTFENTETKNGSRYALDWSEISLYNIIDQDYIDKYRGNLLFQLLVDMYYQFFDSAGNDNLNNNLYIESIFKKIFPNDDIMDSKFMDNLKLIMTTNIIGSAEKLVGNVLYSFNYDGKDYIISLTEADYKGNAKWKIEPNSANMKEIEVIDTVCNEEVTLLDRDTYYYIYGKSIISGNINSFRIAKDLITNICVKNEDGSYSFIENGKVPINTKLTKYTDALLSKYFPEFNQFITIEEETKLDNGKIDFDEVDTSSMTHKTVQLDMKIENNLKYEFLTLDPYFRQMWNNGEYKDIFTQKSNYIQFNLDESIMPVSLSEDYIPNTRSYDILINNFNEDIFVDKSIYNDLNLNTKIINNRYYKFKQNKIDLWKRLSVITNEITANQNPKYLIQTPNYSEEVYDGSIKLLYNYNTTFQNGILNLSRDMILNNIGYFIIRAQLMSTKINIFALPSMIIPDKLSVIEVVSSDVERIINISGNVNEIYSFDRNGKYEFSDEVRIRIPNDSSVYIVLTNPQQPYLLMNGVYSLNFNYVK